MLKNIIIVNDWGHIRGGADNVAIHSAIELSLKGYNVVFFTAVSPIDAELLRSGVVVYCINQKDILSNPNRIEATTKGLYNRTAAKRFKELISQHSNTDTIVHVHTWTKALSASIFRVAFEQNFKIVLTLHDFFSVCPNGGFYNYKKQQICKLHPLSSVCIRENCDSRNYMQKSWRVMRQFIQNQFLNNNKLLNLISISAMTDKYILPLLEGRYHRCFKLEDPVEMRSRESVDICKNKKYLFMGRLSKEKGAELFCEAISSLGKEGVVIGDGYLRSMLEKKYPQIEFKGWLSGEEKAEVIEQCKCFVFTSRWYETFGLVVAEMKSFGIPSIVPAESAAAEQIENGIDGLHFQSGDLDSLKQAIIQYEHTDIVGMQNHLIANFNSEKFSYVTHISKLRSIYDEINGNPQ